MKNMLNVLVALLAVACPAVGQSKVIVVEPITVEKNAATEDFPSGYETILHKLAVERLREKTLYDEVIDPTKPDAPACNDCQVLTGKVILFNKGSRAARFWIGLGAGRAKVKVRFVLTDKKTGKEIDRFDCEGKHYGWVQGNEGAAVEAMGDIVDRLIDRFKSRRHDQR